MSNKILIAIIIILLGVLGVVIWRISMPVEETSSTPGQTQSMQNQNLGSSQNQQPQEPPKQLDVTDNGQLQIKTLTPGTGAVAKSGDTVRVHYTGWLLNGTKFDSSLDRGQPFSFQLGAGGVIPGWDQGVTGMKVGEKRQLVIPYTLAYGENDYGSIPGKSTLVFEVELLGIGAGQ